MLHIMAMIGRWFLYIILALSGVVPAVLLNFDLLDQPFENNNVSQQDITLALGSAQLAFLVGIYLTVWLFKKLFPKLRLISPWKLCLGGFAGGWVGSIFSGISLMIGAFVFFGAEPQVYISVGIGLALHFTCICCGIGLVDKYAATDKNQV